MASRAKESVQPPERALEGDLIELSDALEGAGERGEGGGGNMDGAGEEEQERLLRERFPPRGRVFGEREPRRRGV